MCSTRVISYRLPLGVLAGLLVGACQSAETPPQADARIASESEAVRLELAAVRTNWERWTAAGSFDSSATLLTVDHVALPPNQPPISGRAQWLSWTRSAFANGTLSVINTTESVVADGALAVERGSFVLNFVPGPAAPAGTMASSDTGKFLWHWRKVDGKWLIAAAAWSSNQPAKQ